MVLLQPVHLVSSEVGVQITSMQRLESRTETHIVLCCRQGKSSAHHRCSDHLSLLKQMCQVIALQASELLDGVQGSQGCTLQQELACESGAVQFAQGQDSF